MPQSITAGSAGQAFVMSWCRRRDSNSHSFRHYPLKIACLPIPPRRLRLISGHRHSLHCKGVSIQTIPRFYSEKHRIKMFAGVLDKLFGRDLSSSLSPRSRHRSSARSLRRARRGSSRGRASAPCRSCHGCTLKHATRACRARIAQIGQGQRCNKEHRGQHRRATRQEVGAASSAEQAARSAAAERSSHVGALAMLHKNQANHAQCRKHLNRENHAG